MKDLTSYLETHFEIVSAITISEVLDQSKTKQIRDTEGQGGLYEFAKELTDEFENQYKDVVWGEELDWSDTLEEFLKDRL